MFNFFKKDPPAPAPAAKKLPPTAPLASTKVPPPQQQPHRAAAATGGTRPAQHHQDPLIASGAGAGVFQPSAQNFFADPSTVTNFAAKPPIPGGHPAPSSPSGAPRIERMDVGCGDHYTGEVQYNLPPELQQQAAKTGSGRTSDAATRASILDQQRQREQVKPTPHGIGELISESGRQTYTGYFSQGQREGIGQLVTSRFMLWGFWKNNAVETTSSVRLDSLETLVKYRGFVRAVTGESKLKAELAELQGGSKTPLSAFSQYIATTRYLREGWGEAVYPDGRHVFGRWEGDELFGFGTQLTPAEGERYVGMFHQGKFHGFGVLFLPNGAVCEGDWVHGVFKNANGALTIPNRCVLSGQFNDRNAFSRVNIQLLDTTNMHGREEIDVGLSYVARTQYNSLFFWATNAAVLREEALQQAVPLLALMEQQTDPMKAAKLLEHEIRTRLVKTKRFDNAVRIAQRVIFLMWGSCGSPSHIHSGNGRTALGIMPSRGSEGGNLSGKASSNRGGSIVGGATHPPFPPSSARGERGSSSSSSSAAAAAAAAMAGSESSNVMSATAGLATNPGTKPIAPNHALGWCETQRTGGCIHTGTGRPIAPPTARQLFDDMLSFSTSCRKYWAQLFQTGKDIRRANSGQAPRQQQEGYADDDDDDGLLSMDELLNIVSRAAFDAIFGACRKLAVNVFCHAFYSEQVAAEAALERLRDVTLNDVGIEFARQSDDSLFDIYSDATRELERSFNSQVPTDILHGLHRWSMSIDSATREAQTAGGSADDLIPIHQFTLLRARIPHLVPMTKLVSWLGEQPCFVDPTSAESFCLTTLQACVSMLHDLRSNIRDTQGVLQSPSALEARVDDTLSLLDDQGVPVQIVRRAADYCANMLVLLLGHRQQFLREITASAQRQQQRTVAAAAALVPATTASSSSSSSSVSPSVKRDDDDDDEDDDEGNATPQKRAEHEKTVSNDGDGVEAEQEKEKNKSTDEATASAVPSTTASSAASPAPASPSSTNFPSPSPTTAMRVEPVFLLPPDALHIMPAQPSAVASLNGSASTTNTAKAIMGRLRNSSVIHSATPSPPPPPPSLEEAAAAVAAAVSAAAASTPGGGNVPTHGRPRGQSISSAPLNKSLDEQMLHAVSMILTATGCQLSIGKVTLPDSMRPNRIVEASSVVPSNRKNSFGIKQAFGQDATPGRNLDGVPTKWCFCVSVPPQLLVSAPQLKIYTTKLSTL